MIDIAYLSRGLAALSRAHRAGAMAGHLGAAVLAGYFFAEDHPDLDPAVIDAIRREMDRIIDGEETVWFNPQAKGITIRELFAPPPEASPAENVSERIDRALQPSLAKLRQSGHNVIFASLAVRAVRDHPQTATEWALTGVERLLHLFDNAGPGRAYLGKERGWCSADAVPLDSDDGVSPSDDIDAMVAQLTDRLIVEAACRRQGVGGLFHIINHAAGIHELAMRGYRSTARKALAAWWTQLRIWLALPNLEAELGKLEKAEADPRTAAYWEDARSRNSTQFSGWLTHRLKTLYGFFSLWPALPAEKRPQALDRFLYLMR
ncbi:MAG: hypothetical protein D6741_14295 [Planctomycetota bacterium]|nr:MAG: hypothetical protein D6741_14295 [Planctomycetota bacterium]